MSRTLRFLALAATTSLFSVAAHAEQLKVVATFSIIGDFARQVGGDRIELTTLVGPGGDAHVYEPKPADAVATRNAQVVLVNGLHFEGFLKRLIDTSETKASVAELTRGVETIENAEHDHAEGEKHDHGHGKQEANSHHHHGALDPHAFQSVANAQIYVKNIAEAFCAADAAGCETYKANAATYTEKLKALDAEVKASLGAIPQERRTVITSHEAFGYFGKAYGIRFLAPEGVSTESEASASDVAALVRQVREDHASAIFVENITNSKLVEQIAAETGVKIGGTLFSDALSDGPPAATYIDMIRANASTISGAISGS